MPSTRPWTFKCSARSGSLTVSMALGVAGGFPRLRPPGWGRRTQQRREEVLVEGREVFSECRARLRGSGGWGPPLQQSSLCRWQRDSQGRLLFSRRYIVSDE